MARIAIVDDSRLARTYTATVVRKAGHEATEIDPSSIFDVLKLLRDNPPDMLLTDYLMPGCPGVSLARACHEDPALAAIPIVVITAHHDEEVEDRLKRVGVSAFLHKPFEPEGLAAVIRELLPEA